MTDEVRKTTPPAVTVTTPATLTMTVEGFRPTMMLRWRLQPHTTTRGPVLEQAWQDAAGAIYWQPVAAVIAED